MDFWGGSLTQDFETDLKPMGTPWMEGDNTEGPGIDLIIVLSELQTRGPPAASLRLILVPDSPNHPSSSGGRGRNGTRTPPHLHRE